MRRQEDISSKTTAPEDRAGTTCPTEAGLAMNSAATVPVKARRVPCSLGYFTFLNVISFNMKAGIVNEKDNEIIEARKPMDALADPGKVFWKKPEEFPKHIGRIEEVLGRKRPDSKIPLNLDFSIPSIENDRSGEFRYDPCETCTRTKRLFRLYKKTVPKSKITVPLSDHSRERKDDPINYEIDIRSN